MNLFQSEILKNTIKIMLIPIFITFIPILKAKDTNNIIRNICIKQFKDEMGNANVDTPKGMASYTCDCFLLELGKGYNIDSAIKSCQAKASNKFKLINPADKQL